MHDLVARLILTAAISERLRRAERVFLRELLTRIPLPGIDEKLQAAARAAQLTGIHLCLVTDGELTRCACFMDILKEESHAELKEVLVAAGRDWASLARTA